MSSSEENKPVVIWTDGCFDMMHYGHANALRQAKALGDYLIVGVHSDEAIRKNKGPPVMNEEERYEAVAACKWVDEVYRDAPFQTKLSVLEEKNVDYCVHGDDIITTADGEDCYAEVKAAGKFKTVPRTKGVSTTDLVGRMLLMTKSHFISNNDSVLTKTHEIGLHQGTSRKSPYTRLSKFIPSTKQIFQFSDGKTPKENDKIVYVDGTFDLFHIGHISFLKKAKTLGDYLIVGIHTDSDVNQIKGENHPLNNLHERVLAVLSCRYVDEVIIGAPYCITEGLLNSQNIHIVAHGADEVELGPNGEDPYQLAKDKEIFQIIDGGSTVTTSVIIDRILANRAAYIARNKKKEKKEIDEYEQNIGNKRPLDENNNNNNNNNNDDEEEKNVEPPTKKHKSN